MLSDRCYLPEVILSVGDGGIAVKCHFRFKDLCRSVPGGKWNPALKCWQYAATPAMAKTLCRLFAGLGVEHDDKFGALAKQAQIVDNAAQHKTAKTLPPIAHTKTWPWLHQLQAFWFSLDLDSAMLAMEMGTGKSKVAVDLIVNRKLRKVLITCPLSVVNVWPREFRTHAWETYDVLALSEGSVEDRTRQAEAHMRLAAAKKHGAAVVINHEALWREPFAKFAREYGFDVLVVDESHRAKQHDGQFSLFLTQLARSIPVRFALTGSPMPHSPLDIFAQYRFLDAGIYGPSWFRFKNRYAVLGGFQNKQIVRFDNLQELNDKFYSIAFRVTKDEALDLPEELHEIRTCDLEIGAKRIYDDLQKKFYAKVEKGEITVGNALVELLRLQQLTGGHITTDDGVMQRVSDAKSGLLRETLEDIAGPVVVFAQFHEDLNIIRAVSEAIGRRYGEVSGRLKDGIDADACMADVDVLGCQIHAGGVGIDLTRASHGIYYSTGFNLGDYIQSLSRLHRPGQKNKVLFIHLLTRGTVDDKVYGALASRRSIIEAVLEKVKE